MIGVTGPETVRGVDPPPPPRPTMAARARAAARGALTRARRASDGLLARYLPGTHARRRERAVLKAWANTPPNQQLVVWMQMLDNSPELRAAFRDALRVRGMEELSGAKPKRTVRDFTRPRR